MPRSQHTALPPRLIQDAQECFTLFSRNSLTMPLSSLSPFLHALGIAPSIAEMRDLENELRDGLEVASGVANGTALTDHEREITKAQVMQVVRLRVANHHRRRTDDDDSDEYHAPKNKKAASKQASLAMWRQELEETFNIFDTNHDGFIDQHEFMQVMTRLLAQGSSETMIAPSMSVGLVVSDSDSPSGTSGEASTKGGITVSGPSNGDYFTTEELNALMREIDFDKDGRLSFSDFKRFMGFGDRGSASGGNITEPS